MDTVAQSKTRHSSGVMKAEHELRRLSILHASLGRQAVLHWGGSVSCADPFSKHGAPKVCSGHKTEPLLSLKRGLGTSSQAEEAEREGSWGRLLAAFSVWSSEDHFGKKEVFPCETQTERRQKNALLLVHTHTHTHARQTPNMIIRLLHIHADFYKGRTSQSCRWNVFCGRTQICFTME